MTSVLAPLISSPDSTMVVEEHVVGALLETDHDLFQLALVHLPCATPMRARASWFRVRARSPMLPMRSWM